MEQEIKDKIWGSSKPASEWVSSYLVIPVLDVIELIEEYERKDATHKRKRNGGEIMVLEFHNEGEIKVKEDTLEILDYFKNKWNKSYDGVIKRLIANKLIKEAE